MGELEKSKFEHEMLKFWRIHGANAHMFLLRRLAQHHEPTFAHSMRVGYYSYLLGQQLGMADDELNKLLNSAYLHDIGMLTIPQSLLNKQEPLTEEEWQIIRMHCTNGLDILSRSLHAHIDPEVIMYHHENLDGTGYFGLKEQEISLPVRIVRVVDTFDGLTFPHSHNQMMSMQQAFEELYRWNDVLFDEQVVEALYPFIHHE